MGKAAGTHRSVGVRGQGRVQGPEFRGKANQVRRGAEAERRAGLKSLDDAEAKAKAAAQNTPPKAAKAKGGK